jgi:hypothetical protein
VVKASTEMRRFGFYRVSDRHLGDAEYFKNLWGDFSERGGGEHLYHHLMRIDVSNFTPQRDFPMTAAKSEMQKSAIDKPIQWLIASIREEADPMLRFINGFNKSSDLTDSFNSWLKQVEPNSTIWPTARFSKAMSKFFGDNLKVHVKRMGPQCFRGYDMEVDTVKQLIIKYTRRDDLFDDE